MLKVWRSSLTERTISAPYITALARSIPILSTAPAFKRMPAVSTRLYADMINAESLALLRAGSMLYGEKLSGEVKSLQDELKYAKNP